MAQKLFRDPVYDYISIDKTKYSWLINLINCREVQRLRYISQLGLSQFTYPGSNHSRFAHSLGVLNLMLQCLEHLKQDYDKMFKRLDKEALLAASLLHDIGHSPLSHVTEEFFGNHEEKAVEIILDEKSEVYGILCKRSKTLPLKVASLIAKKPLEKTVQPPLWQKSLISSQLDMDRLDYLRRDSLCSGAEYGNFDCFRIIHTMQLEEKKIRGTQKDIWVVWPDKSKYALEEYIFSRFYMYQSVYFHHTTRGFECLLKLILKRAKEISKKIGFTESLLKPLKPFFSTRKKVSSSNFQNLTDNLIFAQITIWQASKDKILRDLSKRLLLRKGIGWKKVLKDSFDDVIDNKIPEVRDFLKKSGFDPQYYLFKDKTEATVYEPYRPETEIDDQSSVNSIMLYDSSWKGTGFCEISSAPGLDRLQSITKPSPIIHYYFPKEHETKIKNMLS